MVALEALELSGEQVVHVHRRTATRAVAVTAVQPAR
jgi:hypothetical protein